MKFKRDVTIHCREVDTTLGRVLLAATDIGLAGLWFESQRHSPQTTGWLVDPVHPVLCEAAAQLQDYLAGRRQGFELPLDLSHGTAFQQSVWRALLAIPAGSTWTYAALCRHIGKPAAVRAVGTAVGRNPISIVVPCHRVLGSDGTLTGYAGGLARKAALIQLEGGHCRAPDRQLSVPATSA